MTTLKKNALAIALVGAMGFAANASAFTIVTSPSGPSSTPLTQKVATFDIIDSTTAITVNESVSFNIVADDLIIGRDSAYAIRVDLTNGAKFATTPALTLGPNGGASWASSVSAGGAGSSYVIYRLTPTVNPLPIADTLGTGVVVTLNSGFQVKNLAALQDVGNSVDLKAQFQDPTGSSVILTQKSFTLLRSGNPLDVACHPEYGDTKSLVDVGTGDPAGTYESKTTFSYYGTINGGASYYYFDAGELTFDVLSGYTFVYAADDEFVTTLTGSFPSFAGGSVTMDGHCGGSPIAGTVSDDGTTVTFEYTGADFCAPTTSSHMHVNFGSDGSVIDPTTITVSTEVTRGAVSATIPDCDLLPIRYNGSTVKVATFNPGGNATQQSFLRITNPSILDGNVTITGIDDAGNAGDSPVVLHLAPGKSVQVNSDALENGGAGLTGKLGDGQGKWRLVVTGEFGGMRVASLNRNTTDGTVTNLTDYDTNQEQSTQVVDRNNDTINVGSDSY